MDQPLWVPTEQQIESSQIRAFARRVEQRHGIDVREYRDLWQWSVDHPGDFWREMWETAGIVAEGSVERVLENPSAMPGARWFPDVRLNFAENLLQGPDDQPAIIARDERGGRSVLNYRQLRQAVAGVQAKLRDAGVGPGDAVAAYIPNITEAVVAMLAATGLGAVWSSGSPDFGVSGIVDRFAQVAPKVLVTVDGYAYGGKEFDIRDKVRAAVERLPSIERTFVVPYLWPDGDPVPAGLANATRLEMADLDLSGSPTFDRGPFDRPLYALFSSGTTGAPKAIVHGVGGTLLQHNKEHMLHTDVKAGDRLLYFTTCGWMMWNWLVSALACNATVVLFEGSPFHPSASVLWDVAAEEKLTALGLGAKYIDAIAKEGLEPARSHDLSALRTILSTGSPLSPASFEYVYRSVKDDLLLASVSGGTDIVSCFVIGCPIRPVRIGEIQCRGLGMAVDVVDDDGNSVPSGKGELVCRKPFPSMPVGFLNDSGDVRYRSAYFERFPGLWAHGDFAELTASDGVIIHGRSDAVLNPGGVRIGTAEIYRQVEDIPEIEEAVVIGQDWEDDVRVVLFVRMRSGHVLDEALEATIRKRIRENASPRHVPARIVTVADIPRTRSGKIVEIAVRDVVHGRPVKNIDALLNPEALELFKEVPALRA